MTRPTALQSSRGTRHRTHMVLNWSTSTHLVCGPKVVQPGPCYSSCFWSTALSSSLLLPLLPLLPLIPLLPLLPLLLVLFSSASLSGFHQACTSTSLGAPSLRLHPVSFHPAVCCQARGSYIVPGATLLGAVLIWYNRLLQPALATQAASIAQASTCCSQLCLRLPFFFFSFFSLLLLSRAST